MFQTWNLCHSTYENRPTSIFSFVLYKVCLNEKSLVIHFSRMFYLVSKIQSSYSNLKILQISKDYRRERSQKIE